MKKKFLSFLTAVIILCMLLASVSSAATPSIRLSASSLTFNCDQKSGYFYIYTDGPWLAVNTIYGWLRFEGQGYGGSKTGNGSATIWFTMDENPGTTSRTGSFIVYNTKTNEYQTISITQKGNDKQILQLTNTIKTTYDHYGKNNVELKIKSTDTWKIESDNAFVTFSKNGGAGSFNEQTVYINIGKHIGFTDRKAKITLSSGKNSVSIDITQTKVPSEIYYFNVGGAGEYYNNTYALPRDVSQFRVDIESAVPWKFWSDDKISIKTSDGKKITEGEAGKRYYLTVTVPKHEVNGNKANGYSCMFMGQKESKHLVVFYTFNSKENQGDTDDEGSGIIDPDPDKDGKTEPNNNTGNTGNTGNSGTSQKMILK